MTSNKEVRAARKSYDLSTSAKWATLSSGNHNVQIVAKASGYRDSEKSAAVTVNKPAATVTLSKGTYKFVSQPTAVSSVIQQDIVCTAAADTYSYTLNQIQVNMSTASTRVQLISTVDVMVNSKVSGSNNYAWYNYNDGDTTLLSTPPTITIASDVQVQSDFYDWFIANTNPCIEAGTYQFAETIATFPSNQTIDFTSNGNTYSSFTFPPLGMNYNKASSTNVYVKSTNTWVNQDFRIVTFATTQVCSNSFFTWFKTYASAYTPTYNDCITFTGESSDFNLSVGKRGAKQWNGTVEYSTDHTTWTTWDGTAISSVDKKLYLRGKNNTKS